MTPRPYLFRDLRPPPPTVGHLLIIPCWHPTKINELYSGHWAKKHRLKRADRDTIALYAKIARTPLATCPRKVEMTIVLRPRQRGADPDAYWKGTLDALTHTGLLIDDNRQYVELAPIRYERGLENDWGTLIRLTDTPS